MRAASISRLPALPGFNRFCRVFSFNSGRTPLMQGDGLRLDAHLGGLRQNVHQSFTGDGASEHIPSSGACVQLDTG